MEEQNSKNGALVPSGDTNLQRLSNSIRITKKLLSVSDHESVIIGDQEWMLRNLDVDRFRNGDVIPEIQDPEEWAKAGKVGKPAWCYYDNDPENGKIYGKLYNWHAVNDPRGLAPKEWKVASDEDWGRFLDILIEEGSVSRIKNWGEKVDTVDFLASVQKDVPELAVGSFVLTDDISEFWINDQKRGNNNFPRSLGLRKKKGQFEYSPEIACWWCSNDLGDISVWRAWCRELIFDTKILFVRKSAMKGQGRSVRCIR